MQQVSAILGSFVTIYLALGLYSLFQKNRHDRKQQKAQFQLLKSRLETSLLKRSLEEEKQLHWNGLRKFVVFRKKMLTDQVYSFDLVPHDRKSVPLFSPGQFLTFHLKVQGQEKPVVRCYSISSAPNSEYYQVTIKRVPGGVSSNYFCDTVEENMILDVQAPRGGFCLEPGTSKPVVLIAGGVGVTPFLSMVESIASEERDRETHLFYSARHPEELIRKEFLESLSFQNENIFIHLGVTRPDQADDMNPFDFHGHLSLEYLKTVLPSNNYEFYICGPDSMMSDLKNELLQWKVPGESIHTEAFGSSSKPASGAKKSKVNGYRQLSEKESEILDVSFSRSNQTEKWDFSREDLLSFIEELEIPIESGCRTGSCGNCETAILEGTVKYVKEMDFPCQQGNCLPCISVPVTHLKLDL